MPQTSFITPQRRQRIASAHVAQYAAPINALEADVEALSLTTLGDIAGTPALGLYLKGVGAGSANWAALAAGDIATALGAATAGTFLRASGAGAASFQALSSGEVATALGASAAGTFLRASGSGAAAFQALTPADLGSGIFAGDTAHKVGSNLASATTVAPASGAGNVFAVTGSTTIQTITSRRSGDWLVLIPASGASWRFGSSGNVVAGGQQRAVGEAVRLQYDGTTWREVSRAPTATRYAAPGIGNTIANASNGTFNKSLSIPAGSLAVGDLIRFRANGVYSRTGTPNLRFRPQLGSVQLVELALQVTVSNQVWVLDAQFAVRAIGASGAIGVGPCFAIFGAEPAPLVVAGDANDVTVDTTAAQTAQLAVNWSASNASNTVTLWTISIEVIRPEATS